MIKVILFIVFGIFVSAYALTAVAWRLFLRRIAVSFGWVPPSAYDYLVTAWRAECNGQFAEAMAAYDEAIRLEPNNVNAQARRQEFVDWFVESNGGKGEEYPSCHED